MASGLQPERRLPGDACAELVEAARLFLAGEATSDEFLGAIDRASCDAFDSVTLDLDRRRRCGFPEVVFAAGKPTDVLLEIATRMRSTQTPFLATRATAEQGHALVHAFPDAVYHPSARTVRIGNCTGIGLSDETAVPRLPRSVAVVCAGTTDLPVADEACETLAWMGVLADRISDIGVAGPQRLRAHVPRLREAAAIVVVAGMEGALPSAVGGYVACPVFAVPTSIGYGTNFGGVAALLSMLNSCAPNVAVVNIDAGFKAAYLAGLVAYA